VSTRDARDAERTKVKRVADPARTRDDILAVAHEEFVENGLSGARVDAIAARTQTTKRMIYYYFGSKDGLYLAVLEQAYARIRAIEQTLDLARLPPVEALRRLTEFTFDYHADNPDFVRLIGIENIHRGRHMSQSEAVSKLNMTVIHMLAEILERGRRAGLFRADIAPVDIHMLISAFCFYRVSNRHTFGHIFDCDLDQPALRARHRELIVNAVLRTVRADTAATTAAPAARKRTRA
jgi:AcrR family transcriptional regulator